jgi:hypothetical protein
MSSTGAVNSYQEVAWLIAPFSMLALPVEYKVLSKEKRERKREFRTMVITDSGRS